MTNKEFDDIWEYSEWLFKSGRLTIEEYNKLQGFIFQFKDEIVDGVYKAL